MTYHFNLRITRRLSNFQTANAEEHALFNMSRIQQTVVLDLRTSTILISVLPTIDQSLRKTCHFEGYLREYKMTQNTLYRRKLKMVNAPWCSSSRIRCIPKAHFAFHTCFGNFCGQNGKIRRQGRQKYNERKSKQRQYCCCCCLHIKSRSGLYSVLSSIRTGPTDADAFRGHRLTTQKGYTYQKKIKGLRKVSTHAIV